jgi:hypothetical protein
MTAERKARSSGDLLPPSPPAEKATACEDQTGQASTGDRSGDSVKLQIEHRVVGMYVRNSVISFLRCSRPM